jgi:hypothetical protein
LPGLDAIANRQQFLGGEPSRRWCRHDRFTARQRMNRCRYTNGRAEFRLLHLRRRERIGPLLFLQIRDRRRILLRGVRFGVGDCGALVGKHGDRAEVMSIREGRRLEHERPAIATRCRRRLFDAKRAWPRWRRADERSGRASCGRRAS